MRSWLTIILVTLAMTVSAPEAVRAAAPDDELWELICEERMRGTELRCGVRQRAVLIYMDTRGTRDITLGFEHHRGVMNEFMPLDFFRLQIDDEDPFRWRIGYESNARFAEVVARMREATTISTRHQHMDSRIDRVERSTVNQGFLNALDEMERLIRTFPAD